MWQRVHFLSDLYRSLVAFEHHRINARSWQHSQLNRTHDLIWFKYDATIPERSLHVLQHFFNCIRKAAARFLADIAVGIVVSSRSDVTGGWPIDRAALMDWLLLLLSVSCCISRALGCLIIHTLSVVPFRSFVCLCRPSSGGTGFLKHGSREVFSLWHLFGTLFLALHCSVG